jgi:FkbM family methyltransferase
MLIDKYLGARKGVIHVGAHIGQERDWYKDQGFTRVLWFEPNTKLFERLQQNIKEYSNQEAFNIGIHDSLKEGTLHISNNDGLSSSILELGLHETYRPDITYIDDQIITLIRMDDFIKEKRIDIKEFNFLNIDVQGTELNVLKSFGKLLAKFEYIELEVNKTESYKGCALLPEVDSYLAKFGFVRLAKQITKMGWGDAFYKRYV